MKKLIAAILILTVVMAGLIFAIVIISFPDREEAVTGASADVSGTHEESTAESMTAEGPQTDTEKEDAAETAALKNRSVFGDEELDVLEDLIFAKAGGEDTSEFLDRLEEISPEDRAAWDEILAFWDTSREEGFVNTIESGGNAISLMEGCPVNDAHEGTLLPDGLPEDDSLCIICLGFQLYSDGRMRDELVGRLEVVRACAMQYPNAWILLTGGPTAFQDSTITEADAMSDWLVENGIEKDRILIENRSMTSATNALFSYELLKEGYPQVRDIAIVSSDYHVSLGSQLFQAQFIMARALGSGTELNVVANASYHVSINDAFGTDIEANWLWILVREQVTDVHNIEGEM